MRGAELTRVAVAVEGWNAEAAIAFVLAARRFASAVTLCTGNVTADGKDKIEVLTLWPETGEEVMLAVDGADEKEAFDTLLAELLGVMEPLKDRTQAVIAPGAERRKDGNRVHRQRGAAAAAPDTGKMATVRSKKSRREVMSTGVSLAFGESDAMPQRHVKQVTGEFRQTGRHRRGERVHHCTRPDLHVPTPDRSRSRRHKKSASNKQAGKALCRPTPKRKPRKRKR